MYQKLALVLLHGCNGWFLAAVLQNETNSARSRRFGAQRFTPALAAPHWFATWATLWAPSVNNSHLLIASPCFDLWGASDRSPPGEQPSNMKPTPWELSKTMVDLWRVCNCWFLAAGFRNETDSARSRSFGTPEIHAKRRLRPTGVQLGQLAGAHVQTTPIR